MQSGYVPEYARNAGRSYVPEYARNAGMGGGGLGSLLGGFIPGAGLISGIGSVLGGIFGNSDRPYKEAMKQYEKGQGYFNPFFRAGTGAIPDYQKYVSGMQNPQEFFKNMMSGYSTSPQAQLQQREMQNALNNYGSASGLLGSTPMQQAAMQSAKDISSQDMQQYYQNLMGIHGGYGQGLGNLLNMGMFGAQGMGQFIPGMADAAYGREAGRNFDLSKIIGGLFGF